MDKIDEKSRIINISGFGVGDNDNLDDEDLSSESSSDEEDDQNLNVADEVVDDDEELDPACVIM